MIEISVTASSTEGTVKQIQNHLGGEITEHWGEHFLTIDNHIAKGNIRFIALEWGVSLLEYDITFFDEVSLIMDTSAYNPIHFAYCLEGYCEHRFESDLARKKLDQFQSVIIAGAADGYHYGYFPKDIPLQINVIQIVRQQYLKKRLNNVSVLNQDLYRVFVDTDHKNKFAYYGSHNLRLADKINALRNVDGEGMMRLLQIEGLVYQILSMHIKQHDRDVKSKKVETTLLTRELKIIRDIAQQIINNCSRPYTLQMLSYESGLTQAKLQEGFKLLYTKTVTEYIRHVRLEAARDYMNTTDMNISEIVYSIGFSSRSYFSKIFKQKFGISPREFLRNKAKTIDLKTVSDESLEEMSAVTA